MDRILFILVFLLLQVPVFAPAQESSSSSSSGENPSTVLIGQFTFTRPTGWQWVDTRPMTGQIQQFVTFHVGNPARKEGCSVFINHFAAGIAKATPRVVAERWKESFLDAPATARFSEPVIVGTNRVVYLELTGTMKPVSTRKDVPDRPGMTQSGAIIMHPEGNVILRLIGPTALVQKAKPEFVRMIEAAMKND